MSVICVLAMAIMASREVSGLMGSCREAKKCCEGKDPLLADTEAKIEGDMDPYRAASQMDTDEIVRLEELRPWMELFAEASYQASGFRRTKNPRIWSLHDLAALTEAHQ